MGMSASGSGFHLSLRFMDDFLPPKQKPPENSFSATPAT